MFTYRNLIGLFTLIFTVAAAWSCKDDPDPKIEEETWEQVTGLMAPMGIAKDAQGRVWVTEAGTGKDDGRLTFISPDGQKTAVLTGLPSVVANGAIEGITRPYVKGNTLLFAHGIAGRVYKLKGELSALKTSSLPLSANDFEILEVRDFARKLPTSADSNSNVMDLHLADNGDLYMLDAGANAIIKSQGGGATLSLFAELPKISTPAPFPVSEEAVPTAFVFDGTRFFVSALSGVPFNEEKSKIFTVTTAGQVNEYKQGFTNLIDIELDANGKPVVLSHGTFSLAAGFADGTGGVSNEAGTLLLGQISRPTALLRKEANTYYLLNFGEGILKKIVL
jgi:hypothetical protein